jgi:Putative Ig domain
MEHHHVRGHITFHIGGIQVKANFTLTFEIAPADGGGGQLALTKSDFTGKVGVPLSDNLGITGGTGGPYSVVDTDVTQLPPGITIDSTGAVAGTPTKEGSYSVGISVSDANG